MAEKKVKGKKDPVLIYEHSENLKIVRDPFNYIVVHGERNRYFQSISGAFMELHSIILNDKLESMDDSSKKSLINIVDTVINTHDEVVDIVKNLGGNRQVTL